MTDSNSNRRPTPRNQFSFSRVKTLDQCPYRYRLRYLKGLKEAFRSIETFLGNSVHDTLEWLYSQRTQGTDPTSDAMLEWYSAHWATGWSEEIVVIRLADDPEHYHLMGREMLTRFHREVFSKDRSETVALEQRLSQRLSSEIVFTGFADRIGRTEKGTLFVIDYKTSKSLGNPSDFSEGLQAPLYAACALENHQENEALAGYHYVRFAETRWQKVTRDHGQELLKKFRNLAEQALTATDFPTRPSTLCAWCGFNAICEDARVPDALSGGRRYAIENKPATLFDGSQGSGR
ncbi:MAG: PD-(D/E)XK nuclease family protein [bacterium]|nr:PD-(D/E)XK nuclease family protein [bacterium]